MPNQNKRGAYSSHRDRQRRRILDAAAELFDERGMDRVTIADIVTQAGIRSSTLYEYFSNKDEIVWAILGDLMTESGVRVKQAMDQGRTALDRITALLEFMADQLVNHRASARFMAEFDAMYARHWSPEQLLSLEAQVSPNGFEFFRALIREGIADGSLRPDLDSDLTMHAVINAVMGAQRRLASLGSRVEVEYGQPVDRLFRETIRIILLGLRAPEAVKAIEHPRQPQAGKRRKRTS